MRFQEIQEACWTGYRQAGTKKKGNRQVPNCVPVEEAVDPFLDNTARELLGLVIIAGGAFAVGTYYTILNKLKKYQGSQIIDALEQKGVTMNRETYEQVKPLLDQFKQALRDNEGEQARALAKRIEQLIIMGKLSAPEPQVPADTALAAKEKELEEDLKKWFKEKWVRFGPDGKIRGDCARGSSKEGKPKCLPQSKAHALGKKGRASAAAKKRREDPNPERRGAAKNVATRVKEDDLDEACWKGYHKEGNKKMFGKTYPNCVKNTKEDIDEAGRIARKAGQPANSKKHSDLYTDENPRGTITGLKFATVEDARASVSKIRSSGRSHAHKVQAAVAMEQRARAAGKASAAAVYRAYINANKKTDESLETYVDQGVCPVCHGNMVAEDQITEKQDACYHKVKSRYKVWPSAYASGALVQCRKKGAANWGTGAKKK
jgi:hypothetical protein